LACGPVPVRLVCIKGPKAVLLPAAPGALREPVMLGKVVVTTHSPNPLDDLGLAPGRPLAGGASDGVAEAGLVDRPDREPSRGRWLDTGEPPRTGRSGAEEAGPRRRRWAVPPVAPLSVR
jgi:hypothetical protein